MASMASVISMVPRASLSCAALSCALSLSACAGEVQISSGGTTSGSGGSSGSCDPQNLPGLTRASVKHPSSGAFVDGYLHLSAQIDGGEERYLVLKLTAGAGFVVATPSALDGPANLVPAGPGRWARLRAEAAPAYVDIVDTTAPESPSLAQSLPVYGFVPPKFRQVFSVVEGQFLLCLGPTPEAESALYRVSLDTGWVEEMALDFYQPCSSYIPLAGAAANGRTWVNWGEESDLHIFDASPEKVTQVAEYLYNPDGIHAYGPVLFAATDGERIAFDPGNESRFFFYSMGSGEGTITHAYLNLPSPKRLLGVVNERAYLVTADGVRAYDLQNLSPPAGNEYSPPLLDYHADIALGEGLATLIAADEERLAVVDEEGTLYVIPLGTSGKVEPLPVYQGAPPADLGCGP